MHLKSPWKCKRTCCTVTEDTGTKTRWQRKGLRDRRSLLTSRNRLSIVDFGEEINQNWKCGFMPLAVTSNSLCLAPPSRPHTATQTLILHGWCLVPCLSALIHNQQKRDLRGNFLKSTWRALSGAVHTVIRTTRSPDAFSAWFNYS